MSVRTENLILQILLESGHNRQDNNQRHDTQRYPGSGNQGNNRDEGGFTLCFQVAQPD